MHASWHLLQRHAHAMTDGAVILPVVHQHCMLRLQNIMQAQLLPAKHGFVSSVAHTNARLQVSIQMPGKHRVCRVALVQCACNRHPHTPFMGRGVLVAPEHLEAMPLHYASHHELHVHMAESTWSTATLQCAD